MKTLPERFWAKVDRRADDECWVWRASKDPRGYGKISVGGGVLDCAHRVAWRLTNGDVPAGLYVLHRCDNRPCVNPAHLFLGTQADNMRDKGAKGREPRGEKRPGAKVNADIVRQIRGSELSQVKLGKLFGIHGGTVGMIRRREIWRHVQ